MTVEDHQRPFQEKIVDHQAVDEELGLRNGAYTIKEEEVAIIREEESYDDLHKLISESQS